MTTETVTTETGSAGATNKLSGESDLEAAETDAASREDGNSKSENSLGLKVGLGVGIPLAILVTAAATWWFMSKRQQGRKSGGGGVSELPYEQPHTNMKEQPHVSSYVPYGQMAQSYPVHAAERVHLSPQELESPPVVMR